MRLPAAGPLVLLGFLACDPSPSRGRPSVILVCLDTVRADHLGCYGYARRPTSPCPDELARDATVFLDATATACWTKPSVPSFLTGTWPAEHGVYEGSAHGDQGETTDLLPDRARTLAEDFAEAGFETAAFLHNAHLRSGQGFEQGFDVYEEGSFEAREIRWRARDWLERRDRTRPFFLYLHFLDAHFPYPVPDGYAQMFAEGRDASAFRGEDWSSVRDAVNDGRRTLSPTELEALVSLYDGAIRYIDDEIGQLLGALRREGTDGDLV